MSQGTRQITYATVSNTAGAKQIYSNAETWGELKRKESDIAMLGANMKPWIKDIEGSDSLGFAITNDSTRLPEGNFTIVFLVQKNDSGN